MNKILSIIKSKRLNQTYNGVLVFGAIIGTAIPAFPAYSGESTGALPQLCSSDCQGVTQNVTGISGIVSDGVNMEIYQDQATANLNWSSFNIGESNTVQFYQPGAEAIAINKIFDNDPSKIYGNLIANGNVYLINANGMLFGENSRVNVRSLIASTLDIQRDENGDPIAIGMAYQDGQAAFEHDGNIPMGMIRIEDGAILTTQGTDADGNPFETGGRIMIFAPQIENSGEINTPEGQTILAASQDKVYLNAIDGDEDIRGFYVEVATGGDVKNLGKIIAEKGGNITLLGIAVNQNGLVQSTTTVSENGSIRIIAKDSINESSTYIGNDKYWKDGTSLGGNTGTVVFGENSITQVIPDKSDNTKVVDDLAQLESWIETVAGKISVEKNVQIRATGGRIDFTATNNLINNINSKTENRIYLAEGSVLDVSGSKDALEDMERNVVAVELRSNELKDSPIQRDGVLRGETIYVDIREGTDLADISGAVGGIERGVDERLAEGGTINLNSDGDVLVEHGVTLDISGGQIEYQDGYISTTQLLKDGELVDIADADPNVSYDGLAGSYSKTDEKWGVTETWQVNGADTTSSFEEGYIEGKNAGNLNINSNGIVMEGSIDANVTSGTYQRDGNSSDYTAIPTGGSISINIKNANGAVQDVSFSEIINPILKSYVTTPPADEYYPGLQLSTQMLKNSGASELKVATYGDIDIDNEVEVGLASGGNLDLLAGRINLDGNIIITGGDVSLTAEYAAGKTADTTSVTVGNNALIDVRGNWVNDTPELNPEGTSAPVNIHGGSVTLESISESANNVFINLKQDSVINASGGAWLQSSGNLQAGDGGDIAINVENKIGQNNGIALDGELIATGINHGGSLSIDADTIRISDSETDAIADNELLLNTDFFNGGGFSSYSLTAHRDGLVVDSDTVINLVAQNMQLNNGYAQLQSTDNLQGMFSLVTKPEWEREAVDLKLGLTKDTGVSNSLKWLWIGDGAQINTETGGNISLSSNHNLYLGGSIQAHGGDVSLSTSKRRSTENDMDLGYIASQGIWLGEQAQIDVSASTIMTPNDLGLRTGQIFNSGTITIDAQQGYVITQQGSHLDVSGTATAFDANDVRADGTIGITEQQIAADAGTITIRSAEGMFLNGTMDAHAADVVGARGGSLTIINNAVVKTDVLQENVSRTNKQVDHPLNPGIIHLHDNDFVAVYATGTDINDEMNGVAHINSSMIEEGGFDSLNLITTNLYSTETNIFSETGKVIIDGGVNLNLHNNLQINTAELVVNGDVNLDSSYVAIGRYSSTENTIDQYQLADSGLYTGNGSLNISSDHIDLYGSFHINGAEQINLNSSGDIRLNGLTYVEGDFEGFQGELATTADLNLDAHQVYATTLTDYKLTIADNAEGKVTISRPDEVSAENGGAAIMSVGSNITVTAPQIIQNGVIKAPGGEITLQSGYLDSDTDKVVLLADSDNDSASKIVLGNGSVTSVALENSYNLFGYVSDGLDWKYQNPYDGENKSINDYLIEDLPEKKIAIDAIDVELSDGSVVDISSSGDLYAYEFVPGIGGSTDVLTNDSGSFAIIPTANNPYGFNDAGIYEGFTYEIGSQVYLSGMDGLAAGNYTILPARYALLPGAYLVTPTNDSSNILPGQTQYRTDNAPIIAGKYTTAGTDLADSLWSGFVVESGSIARTRSEYFDYLASPFFTAKALSLGEAAGRMPIDAGHLALSAINSLIIENTLNANPAAGGNGAWIDIDTPNIKIYSDQQQLPEGYVSQGLTATVDGAIYISANGLNNLGADSILLGGTRTSAANGTVLDVGAENVEIMSETELNSYEILLAAKDKVVVAENTSIIASGDKIERNETINIVGDGALLRVSAADQIDLVRTGVSATEGELLIEEGAMVSASGSMLLQGTRDTILNGGIQVGTEQQAGSLYLGASQISLSNDSNIEAEGLILPTSMLEQFNLDELVLSSYGALNIYNGVDLQLNSLKLEAAAINGIDNDGAIANITVVDTLTFANPHQSDINFAGEVFNENGTLNFTAGQVVFGSEAIDSNEEYISQNLLINGFNNITMTASNGMISQGDMQLGFGNSGGNSGTNANVTLATPMLTVASGGSLSLNTSNAILNLNNYSSDTIIPAYIGGKLTLDADTVNIATRIDMSGGLVAINAIHDINIDGTIDVSGQEKLFYDKTEYIPAGTVSLNSETGDVNINSVAEGVATIDISSASENGGKAGNLAISAANGALNLNGEIAGSGIETGGSFLLDVKSYEDFDGLFATLNQSGFNDQISMRLRNGDMNLGQISTLLYGHDITLAADNGNINLDQITIDASGNLSSTGKGGEIAIWAYNELNVGANTRITTAATTTDSDGGDILLASQTGTVAIDNAARLDLSGSKGGDLQIRAGRTESNDDVKVTMFDAENLVDGADTIRIEAFKETSVDSTLDNLDIATIKTDTITFMNNCSNNGLCKQWSDNGVTIMPGVDIVTDGDLTIANKIDLADWRYVDANGENTIPGQLTIRTGGSIYLNQNLTDGVETLTQKVGRTTIEKDITLSGESWAYRINAGADITAANQLQTLNYQQNTGNLVIASDTKLRTGSGDLDIAISGDLKLTDQTSVIYTFGQAQSNGALDDLTASGVPVSSYFSGQYLDNGGDINIDVRGDITGAVSDQLQTAWQHRVWTGYLGGESTDGIPTVWGVDIGEFEQGIAALGGGNIDIRSGGDISDLNVTIASTRRFDGEMEYIGGRVGYFNYFGSDTTLFGGGDLSVSATGNINGGVFSNDYGHADINAMASINSGSNNLGLIAMMMDSDFSINAGNNLNLQGVINTTWMYHDNDQPYIQTAGKANNVFFYSYSQDSAIDLQALNGDIQIINDSTQIEGAYNISGSDSEYNYSKNDGIGGAWDVYPALTDAVAFNGSVLLSGNLILYPTSNSTLNLLASSNVNTIGGQKIIIPDVNQGLMPSSNNPVRRYSESNSIGTIDYLMLPSNENKEITFSNVPTHINDYVPNRIVALNGSFGSLNQTQALEFFSAKPALITAGNDINSVKLYIQNLRDSDTSIIQAGGDISFIELEVDGTTSETSRNEIKVSGPGRLDVIAGGDIDLASSNGIYTIGNKENNALAETGADITVMAGVGDSINRTNYTDFINRYLDQESYAELQLLITDLMQGYSGNNGLSYEESIELLQVLPTEISELLIDSGIGDSLPLGINSKNLLSYMQSLQSYQNWLTDYLTSQGISATSDFSTMVQAFEQLPVYKQRELVMQIFFNELKEGGKDGATNGSAAYDRGYAAIYELYQDYATEGYDVSNQDNLRHFLSQGTSFDGELSMYRSRVQTEDGGDINILVPGGRVFGGLAAANDSDSAKAKENANKVGVVAKRTGDVNTFTRDDFLVNQSRVFAMDGGDILMWSSETNLDAGRGAKTARGISVAEYSYDEWGNVIILPPTSLSGSGIRNSSVTPGTEPGSVYLFAPIGVVDAGDAGIGTAGNLFVGAVEVKGADNFDIGGVAVGVQVSTQGDVSGMASAGDVTSSATSSALDQVESIAEDKSVADEQLSWLEVFVEGLGDDNSLKVEAEEEDDKKKNKKPRKKQKGDKLASVDNSRRQQKTNITPL